MLRLVDSISAYGQIAYGVTFSGLFLAQCRIIEKSWRTLRTNGHFVLEPVETCLDVAPDDRKEFKRRRSIMLTKTRRFALATVMLWLVFGAGGRAEAGGLALSTPGGLTPGESFRFAFVTDGTTDAASSSIGTYNNLVTSDASTEAGGGGVTYNGVTLTWSAIASTSFVAASTNIGTYGVPVYLASGTQVTSSDDASGL